jgi:hypothetical protein
MPCVEGWNRLRLLVLYDFKLQGVSAYMGVQVFFQLLSYGLVRLMPASGGGDGKHGVHCKGKAK